MYESKHCLEGKSQSIENISDKAITVNKMKTIDLFRIHILQ